MFIIICDLSVIKIPIIKWSKILFAFLSSQASYFVFIKIQFIWYYDEDTVYTSIHMYLFKKFLIQSWTLQDIYLNIIIQ